ncbi:hypothetical protein DPEC_G00015130 [Dallia pectoralis]|uniref:Uncharacterized protein n=1 Tax=Dallia pectoralis TaxID=75939 RepID=A0ACC2HND2_DALPE|nr:hypothetical protein DPEC_G00015130 [Dallia pectoralis]
MVERVAPGTKPVYLFLSGFNIVLVFGLNCGPAEYKTNDDQCCPMCGQGSVVRRDCTFDISTSCIPCVKGTFMNEANGLTKCFSCSHCDPGQGLSTQTVCTTTRNTICNVLEGFFCKSFSSKSECIFAVKHRTCVPGQSTEAPGTKTADTVCVDCPHGFFSQHGVNCTAWKDCAAIEQVKSIDGNSTQDVICEKPLRRRIFLIAPFILSTLSMLICFFLTRAKHNRETEPPEKPPEKPPIPVQEIGT